MWCYGLERTEWLRFHLQLSECFLVSWISITKISVLPVSGTSETPVKAPYAPRCIEGPNYVPEPLSGIN